NPGVTNLGDRAAARASLQKALAFRRSVLASNPRSFEYRRDLAATLRHFSSLGANLQEALQHAQAGLDLIESLLREQPNAPGLRREEALSEHGVAVALTDLSRYGEAIPYYRRALSHSAGSDPANIALYHKRLGALLVKTEDLAAGLQEYQAATVLDEARVRENPANGRAKMDLSYDYSDWGYTLVRLGDPRAAIEQYAKAEKIREELAAADPRDQRAANGLVSIEYRMGIALAENGARKASQQAFLKAAGHAEGMIKTFPDQQSGKAALADVCLFFGRCWRTKWSSCERAVSWLTRARDLYRQLGNEAPLRGIEQLLAGCSGAQ
ncbi:MAG TPA: hypothetical protein VLY04_08705, partial [Bryobacteraceae bacterium]|nr:hypothetical protein [Bryobacteraceae bacterium]